MLRVSNLIAVVFITVAIPALAISGEAGYSVVDRIPGPDGSYDYISVDGAKQRVFVARSNGVMAIDLATRTVTPTLVAGEGVAAVEIISGTDLMLATNGESNMATLFDRNSGRVKARIPTGKEPDAALFDAASGLAFVMNWENEDVTLINVAREAVVATIAVGGKPEAAASDGEGHVYVNIRDTAEIVVIDVSRRRVARRYALPGCEEPTGLAYDPDTRLLVSACHNGTAKLIDAVTGTDRGSVRIGQGADGAIFDVPRRLVYIPCFDGTLAIFPLEREGRAGMVTTVNTQKGARTAALDGETGRLYLPTAEYRTDSEGKRHRVPNTFTVLVVAP